MHVFCAELPGFFSVQGIRRKKILGNTMPWWNLLPPKFHHLWWIMGVFTLRVWHLWNLNPRQPVDEFVMWLQVLEPERFPKSMMLSQTKAWNFQNFHMGMMTIRCVDVYFCLKMWLIARSAWFVLQEGSTKTWDFVLRLPKCGSKQQKIAHLLFLWQWTNILLFTANPKNLLITFGWPRRDTRARQVERSRIGACFVETSHPSAGGVSINRWCKMRGEVGMKTKKHMM